MCVYTCHNTVEIKGQFMRVCFLLLPSGSDSQTQVFRFGSKHLYLLSLLSGPKYERLHGNWTTHERNYWRSLSRTPHPVSLSLYKEIKKSWIHTLENLMSKYPYYIIYMDSLKYLSEFLWLFCCFFFYRNGNISKIHREPTKTPPPQISKAVWRRNKSGVIILHDFKACFKVRVVRTEWNHHKDVGIKELSNKSTPWRSANLWQRVQDCTTEKRLVSK